MGFSDIISRIQRVEQFDPIKETSNIINENSEFLVGLLKNQLRSGKDADEQPFLLRREGKNAGLFPYYSDATVFEKRRKGQQVEVIDYHDTGIFYLSLYAFASGSSFIFDSDVPYLNDILAHAGSGDKIIELSQANIEIFKEEILIPQLQQRFNEFYGV